LVNNVTEETEEKTGKKHENTYRKNKYFNALSLPTYSVLPQIKLYNLSSLSYDIKSNKIQGETN
jgi:hypothetical protein